MNNEDEVIVTIDEEGNSEVRAGEQVTGSHCLELTRAFRKLGKEVSHRLLPTYYKRSNHIRGRVRHQ